MKRKLLYFIALLAIIPFKILITACGGGSSSNCPSTSTTLHFSTNTVTPVNCDCISSTSGFCYENLYNYLDDGFKLRFHGTGVNCNSNRIIFDSNSPAAVNNTDSYGILYPKDQNYAVRLYLSAPCDAGHLWQYCNTIYVIYQSTEGPTWLSTSMTYPENTPPYGIGFPRLTYWSNTTFSCEY